MKWRPAPKAGQLLPTACTSNESVFSDLREPYSVFSRSCVRWGPTFPSLIHCMSSHPVIHVSRQHAETEREERRFVNSWEGADLHAHAQNMPHPHTAPHFALFTTTPIVQLLYSLPAYRSPVVSPDRPFLQREMATSAKTATAKPATSTSATTALSKTAVKARGAFTRGQTIVGLQVQTAESKRLAQDKTREANWKRWGPYLSERQWATVREDYSPTGSW